MKLQFSYKGEVKLSRVKASDQEVLYTNHNAGTSNLLKLFMLGLAGLDTSLYVPMYVRLADQQGFLTNKIDLLSKSTSSTSNSMGRPIYQALLSSTISNAALLRPSTYSVLILLCSNNVANDGLDILAVFDTNRTINDLITAGSNLRIDWSLKIDSLKGIRSDVSKRNHTKYQSTNSASGISKVFANTIVGANVDSYCSLKSAILKNVADPDNVKYIYVPVTNKTIYVDTDGNYFLNCNIAFDKIDKAKIDLFSPASLEVTLSFNDGTMIDLGLVFGQDTAPTPAFYQKLVTIINLDIYVKNSSN